MSLGQVPGSTRDASVPGSSRDASVLGSTRDAPGPAEPETTKFSHDEVARTYTNVDISKRPKLRDGSYVLMELDNDANFVAKAAPDVESIATKDPPPHRMVASGYLKRLTRKCMDCGEECSRCSDMILAEYEPDYELVWCDQVQGWCRSCYQWWSYYRDGKWLADNRLQRLSTRSWDRMKRVREGKAQRVRVIRLQNMEKIIHDKYPGEGLPKEKVRRLALLRLGALDACLTEAVQKENELILSLRARATQDLTSKNTLAVSLLRWFCCVFVWYCCSSQRGALGCKLATQPAELRLSDFRSK